VERGTGIAITVDDLADIGADYYALGHIHNPQQVGIARPAYYAGSIYPKNFGETHQAGFNVVDTSTYPKSEIKFTRTARVDFPHPQNLKIESSGTLYEIPDCGIAYKRVWLEITCTKEQRGLIDTDKLLAELLAGGAVEGSRVTVNELPVETVRAAEIAGVESLPGKFQIWAEQSGKLDYFMEHSLSMTGKIDGLEENIRRESGAGSGEWELVSVRVRGAVGIRKGIGREEIAVNFDDYDAGLVALCGANGKGKTTLIENCHPYPQLLTRKGKLQDHFYLRDSFREVVYRTPDGIERRFLVQIDGQNKSGACKYFAFSRPTHNMDWEPLAGVDGNLKPYEELVVSTFGPLELYLRTAFTTQRPNRAAPDLTEATAGEKKGLFVELAGIEYLQRIAEAAMERFKAEDGRAHDAELQAGMLEQAVAEKPDLEQDIRRRWDELTIDVKKLDEITAKGKDAKADIERLEVATEKERARANREGTIREDIEEREGEIISHQLLLKEFEKLIKNRAAFEEQVQGWEHYAAVMSAESEKKQQILEKNLQKQREFSQKQQEHQQKVRETEQEKQKALDDKRELEKQVQSDESDIRVREREAQEFDKTCPTCGQELPAEKIEELTEKRNRALSFIKSRHENIEGFKKAIAVLDKNIFEITDMLAALAFDEPRPKTDEPFDDTALREAQTAQGEIDITGVRQSLVKAAAAQARIEQLTAAIAANSKILDERKAELAALEAAADPAVIVEIEEARKKHADLMADYTGVREIIARHRAEVEARQEELEKIITKEAELGALRETLAAAMAERAEWDLIARGFGRDGIQALELDALAPGIAETANRILSSAYGERFRIEIRTTRMGGAGKKTRQIEDFLIYVIDAADGEAVLLDDKSGGESVWIKRAIYDAFAVIRKRNTGFAFLTCFQDEADGALDSAAKTAYCRMLEAAHAESALRHTVIITHSEEVKAMIPQKIDMEEL
ncbi:MAG: hypothetical protein LBK02_08650, partial [Treponema sp.]|nr:hypothetical protein [Treponema sp.]